MKRASPYDRPVKKSKKSAAQTVSAVLKAVAGKVQHGSKGYGPMAVSAPSMSRKIGLREVKGFDCVLWTAANGIQAWTTPLSFTEPGHAGFNGITCVNEVTQGANYYQRVGTKIVIKSIQLRFSVQAGAQTDCYTVRWALIYDRQTNGTAGAGPILGDIFQQNGVVGTNVDTGVNLQNRSRFVILRDRMVDINAGAGLCRSVNEFVKCRFDTEYSTNNGNIGDIRTGSLLFVCGIGTALSVLNPAIVDFWCRIRYYD